MIVQLGIIDWQELVRERAPEGTEEKHIHHGRHIVIVMLRMLLLTSYVRARRTIADVMRAKSIKEVKQKMRIK